MMNKLYGISIICIPSDRLETNEYGEEFYPCMSEEELQRIEKEKDRNALTTYLLNTLSMMDSTISAIATSIEKGLPIQVKILFTIKDAIKGSVLNMGNEELSVNEKITIGGVTIAIGVATIYFELGIIASLIISYLTTWFLTRIYILLRDTTLYLWQDMKDLANDTWKRTISLIESDTRSLEDIKESLTNKVADEILQLQDVPQKAFKKNISSQDYDNLISLLCEANSNHSDIHRYLECSACISYALESTKNKEFEEIDTPLHTSSNTLQLSFEAQCINHKDEALINKEIYVFSLDINHFVDRAISDNKGIARFENILVKDNGTSSQVYFVLKQLGFDEEQSVAHTLISPRITINPNEKKNKHISNTKQKLHFARNIPQYIQNNDSIKPNIKVISIECKNIKQSHTDNTNIHNTNIESNHTNNTIESITLQAQYAIKDSQKKYIKGDEQTYLRDSIQKHKHKTKWGYIVFDKDEDIKQTLNKLNQTQPLIYSKRFKELEHIKGDIVTIPYKQEWQDKQVRFFAYLWRAHKDVGWDMEIEEQIPPNVIRIETQDDSGEFIEIVLPDNDNGSTKYSYDNTNNNNDDELNTLLNEAKDILYEISPLSSLQSAYENLSANEYKEALGNAITILPQAKVLKSEKIIAKAKNIYSKIEQIIDKNKNKKDVKRLKTSKYATKQEVIDVLKKKYKLKTSKELNDMGYKQFHKNKNVYMAKDNKQIKEIWKDITEGAEVLEDAINTKTGEKIPMRKLSDGTILKLRKKSDSGGSTIEIGNKKIHNKAKEDGDW